MRDGLPLVLAASVSQRDRRDLEKTFKDAGFEVRSVQAAEDARVELEAHAGACVLVIDAGLLEAPHDDQWRVLRGRCPDLGAVVRCLVGQDSGMLRAGNGRTIFVHPDRGEILVRAARSLVA